MFFGFSSIIPVVETIYFSWESGPAVVEPISSESYKGFFIPVLDRDWETKNLRTSINLLKATAN